MRTKWFGLLCACAAAPAVTQAQVPAQTAAPAGAPAPAPTTANSARVDVVAPALLPGIGVPRNRLPHNVEQLGADAINSENAVSLPELMGKRLPSVNVNEIQGNPFLPDVNYHGFSASPLLGTPQGLSVFLDGVRVKEAFGDVINWDLLPQAAIAALTLMPGSNPLFGLNTLGAAIAMRMKSGYTHPGATVEAYGGSFRRVSGQFETGHEFDDGLHVFAAGTWFNERTVGATIRRRTSASSLPKLASTRRPTTST